MTASSADDEFRSFFTYYQAYAQTGIHAASAAGLTIFGLLATIVNPWFIVPAIAIYVLPLVFLYLTEEGDRVPSVVGDGDRNDDKIDNDDTDSTDDGTTETDFDAAETESTVDTDASSQQSNSDDESDSLASRTATADTTDERDSDAEHDWVETDTPTDESLLDAVCSKDGAYAVGAGGVVLGRTGDDWEVVVERGPTAKSNPLLGVDATADGRAIWFTGDSGVLGRYADGRLTDHSAPKDQTSPWTDIAVTGEAGEEQIHLVNGSGELLRGEYEAGTVEWGDIEKPGGGSSISSITFADSDCGYVCDTNQGVYETTDGGESYETIGIEDANTDFNGVAATDSTVVVAGGDGSIFRYDGSVWTRLHAGSTLSAIDLGGETGLAAGDDGAVYELIDENWESVETPVDADLSGIVIDTDSGEEVSAVAVGTDGTVIERD